MYLQSHEKEKLNIADVNAACKFALKDGASERHFNRFELCESLFGGRRVVHVGCCDHVGLVDRKIENNVWMHGVISKVASECIGFDIDQDAVDYVKEKHGVSNVYTCDLTKTLPDMVRNNSPWDFLFLGEVIEHIGSPVAFLHDLKHTLGSCVSRLALSCPNAFKYQNFTNSLKHCEYINSDHRYWFSPFTISKILEDSGYSVESMYFVSGYPVLIPSLKRVITGRFGFRSFMRFVLLSKYPMLRDTLLITARLN